MIGRYAVDRDVLAAALREHAANHGETSEHRRMLKIVDDPVTRRYHPNIQRRLLSLHVPEFFDQFPGIAI